MTLPRASWRARSKAGIKGTYKNDVAVAERDNQPRAAEEDVRAVMTKETIVLNEEDIARLSKAQRKAIEALKREIWRHDTLCSYEQPEAWNTGKYEVKKWEVTMFKDSTALIFLSSVVGLRGDEGSMAEIFARTKRLIAIGKRGGCRLLNPGRFTIVDGHHVRVSSAQRVHGIRDCASLLTN